MDNLKCSYENYWNRNTDVSDCDVTTPERKRRLLETLSHYLIPGDKVLDLGCAGQFTNALEKAGFDVLGMDIYLKRHLDCKEGAIFHILQAFWFRLVVDIRLEELMKESDSTKGWRR
jgi:hypothetical protein